MGVWLTYSPEDFLLFSEEVYWRLFELHNAALWPGQFGALAAGIAVLVLLRRPPSWAGRAIAAILALAWAVSGLFFLPRYATINWLAADLVPVFLVQVALCALLGVFLNSLRPAGTTQPIGFAICVYGMFLHPFVTLADGRSLAGADLFMMAPDPTAIVTLGVLASVRTNLSVRLLAVIPLLWCLASWATLATLGTWEAWIMAAALLVFVVTSLMSRRQA